MFQNIHIPVRMLHTAIPRLFEYQRESGCPNCLWESDPPEGPWNPPGQPEARPTKSPGSPLVNAQAGVAVLCHISPLGHRSRTGTPAPCRIPLPFSQQSPGFPGWPLLWPTPPPMHRFFLHSVLQKSCTLATTTDFRQMGGLSLDLGT